jgi:8-oxo-dGTP pyrophosphatase MutT (NUDIX family)
MNDDFFLIKTKFGICRVAKSLRHFDVPWEEYLKKRKEECDPLDNIGKVSGISVRGWLCRWQRGKIRASLGQRAKHDSSPNMYEAWGGKVDPGEKILEALIREFFEETGLILTCIYDQVGGNDVFDTPKSKRWIEQIHFLVEAEKSRKFLKSSRRGSYPIVLDPNEHQNFMWAPGRLDALGNLRMTGATRNHFEPAVAKFREKFPCPKWQKPLAFF